MQQDQQPKVMANIRLDPTQDGGAVLILTQWGGLRVETFTIPSVQIEYFLMQRNNMFQEIAETSKEK